MKASAAADVLDNSNGWVGELSVFHKMQIGRLSLTPALGVLYYDENFSDYYYGISESESRRSGLASYSAQDARVLLCQPDGKIPDRRARRIDGERRIQRAAGRDYRQPDG